MNNNYNQVYVKKSSSKTLYLAVFVTALLVATMSGTFAFFTLYQSDETTVKGDLLDVNIQLDVNKLEPGDSIVANEKYLIPLDLVNSSENFVDGELSEALTNGCVDRFGYSICDVFRIDVSINNDMEIDGLLRIKAKTDNDVIKNIKWMLLGPKSDTIYDNIKSLSNFSTDTYLNVSNVNNSVIDDTDTLFTINQDDYSLLAGTSYYYIVVWLEKTGNYQNDHGDYIGVVTFKAKDTEKGEITAIFND